jgi:4'-phosphopantetheinyl transferase EntD
VIEDLLPPEVATACLAGEGDPSRLLDEELRAVSGAVQGRQREFAAGRICARAALGRFGYGDVPLLSGKAGQPLWPDGVTGSITHTKGFAAAAVDASGRFRAIGIDAERTGHIPDDILSEILLPSEARWIDSLSGEERQRATTLVFSAKEAFFKCQYAITAQWLDFLDVAVEARSDRFERGCFLVRPAGKVELFERYLGVAVVHFSCQCDLVTTAMVIAAS